MKINSSSKKKKGSASETKTKVDLGTKVAEKVKIKVKLGTKVAKKFGFSDFFGRVVAYDAEIKCWRVKYEDGDEEDLTTEEAIQAADYFFEIDDFQPAPEKKNAKKKKKKQPKKRMRCLMCNDLGNAGENLAIRAMRICKILAREMFSFVLKTFLHQMHM